MHVDETIVLNLSNNKDFCFDGAYVDPSHVGLYSMEHIGMSKDSFLINNWMGEKITDGIIEFKYFLSYPYLKFYAWRPGKRRVIVQNRGDDILYLSIQNFGVLKLECGEQKEVLKENFIDEIDE